MLLPLVVTQRCYQEFLIAKAKIAIQQCTFCGQKGFASVATFSAYILVKFRVNCALKN